jgi:hypothetical protein
LGLTRCPYSSAVLHVVQAVLYQVQVGAVTRPVDDREDLLEQERLYALGAREWYPAGKEVFAFMEVHELQ